MSETVIIIPTYNEKENIEALISGIFRCAPNVEVLVVDDNSPDGTGLIADRIARKDKRVAVMHMAARKERNVDGLREALKNKEARYVMEMDADFTHDPEYIPLFIEEIKRNDIVIGSRFVKGGSDAQRKFARRCLSRAVNCFIRKYLGISVKDCTSGYRCYRRNVLDSFDMDSIISKGPAVLEEILYMAFFKNYKIKEIPVILRERAKGRSKLNFKKLYRTLKDILAFERARIHEKEKRKNKELEKFDFVRIPGRIINTISMIIIFYAIITPAGVLLRFFRKDILDKKTDKSSGSYWIKRKETFLKESYRRLG
jgi:dolichol-phosphate mannosyltransferase